MESTEVPIYSVDAHNGTVNAIDGVGGLGIGEGAPEIVTGSKDGEYVIKKEYAGSSFIVSIFRFLSL